MRSMAYSIIPKSYFQVLTRIDKIYKQPPPVTRNVTAFTIGRRDLFPTGTITFNPCFGVFCNRETIINLQVPSTPINILQFIAVYRK